MRCIDISFPTPDENILCDEVLLYLAEKEKGGEVLRFWESQELFVVLGRIGKVVEDVHVDKVLEDQIPVLRRSSGGGTVLQGQGCLNFSLILSKDRHPPIRDLRKSYSYILNYPIEILKDLSVEASFYPTSDLALSDNQKKFSGNAQKRGKKYILHHGTILYKFELSNIEKYLKMPKDIPQYRQSRDHLNFITNVDVPADDLKAGFKKKFRVETIDSKLNNEEEDCLEIFLKTKNVFIDMNKFC